MDESRPAPDAPLRDREEQGRTAEEEQPLDEAPVPPLTGPGDTKGG